MIKMPFDSKTEKILYGFSKATGAFEHCSSEGELIKNYIWKPSDMVYFIPEDETIEEYFATQKTVTKQLEELIKRVKDGEVWELDDGNFPKNVEIFFSYPGGKQENIDMFIASKYGTIRQIDTTHFTTTIPSSEREQIALMLPRYVVTRERSDERSELASFLLRYNLYHNLRQVCDDFMWAGCGQNHPLRNEGRNLVHEYIQIIRNKRSDIYAHLVANNQVSGKWVSEQRAYSLVKSLYPDAVYQFKADWLGLQSIDIMIPSKSIAIEYQGEQHYSAVPFFGGEEGYRNRLILDQIKRQKCAEKKISLIEWRYDQPLTAEYIKLRIEDEITNPHF